MGAFTDMPYPMPTLDGTINLLWDNMDNDLKSSKKMWPKLYVFGELGITLHDSSSSMSSQSTS